MQYILPFFILIFVTTGCKTNITLSNQEANQDVPGSLEPGISDSSNPSVDSEVERGFLAKLSSVQAEQLMNMSSQSHNLGVKSPGVVIPSYIPQGFEVDDFSVSEGGDEYEIHVYYDIQYTNKDTNSCFGLAHYAFDAPSIGEPLESVDRIENVKADKLNLNITIGHMQFSRVSKPEYITFKLIGSDSSDGPFFYRFYSPANCEKTVSIREVVEIAKSLQYLDPQLNLPLNVENAVEVEI